MEASKSVDHAPLVVPSEDRATRRRRRRHLRSSVYFVSVAAFFGGVCLVIAVRNAAQVTALKQRLERLEKLEEGAAAVDDDALSESVSTAVLRPVIPACAEGRFGCKRFRSRKPSASKRELEGIGCALTRSAVKPSITQIWSFKRGTKIVLKCHMFVVYLNGVAYLGVWRP